MRFYEYFILDMFAENKEDKKGERWACFYNLHADNLVFERVTRLLATFISSPAPQRSAMLRPLYSLALLTGSCTHSTHSLVKVHEDVFTQ